MARGPEWGSSGHEGLSFTHSRVGRGEEGDHLVSVSTRPAHEWKFPDFVETDANMEEITPSQRPTASRSEYDILSACPYLRLGRIWQHYSIRGLASKGISSVTGGQNLVNMTVRDNH